MASILRSLFLSLLFHSILLVRCDDKEDDLLRGINQYRTSLNLTALTKNKQAECLAGEVADTFNNQPCTANRTELRGSDYPNLLTKCRLSVNTTQDGQILPACAPDLQPRLILSNYTSSQYARYLNDTQFSGIGIGSEDDWIVVVLTTSTPNGSFSPGSGSSNPGNGASSLIAINPIVVLLISLLVLV